MDDGHHAAATSDAFLFVSTRQGRQSNCFIAIEVARFVAERLGRRFIEPPPFDLAACYAESSVTSPLVFVLSSGADPMADLLKFAGEVKMSKRFDQVSLGQGQGPKAESLIKQAME